VISLAELGRQAAITCLAAGTVSVLAGWICGAPLLIDSGAKLAAIATLAAFALTPFIRRGR